MAGPRDGFLTELATGASDTVLDGPEATRITESAIAAITVLGWSRLTMSDVARRAHIGRATLYRYFAGKGELRNAVMQYEVRRLVAGSASARAAATTVDDALTASFTYMLSFLRDNELLERMRHTDREILLDAVNDSVVIAAAREFSAQLWTAQIYGADQPSEAEMTHLRTACEITTRLSLSLATNPDSVVDFSDAANVHTFARHFLAPLFVRPVAAP